MVGNGLGAKMESFRQQYHTGKGIVALDKTGTITNGTGDNRTGR